MVERAVLSEYAPCGVLIDSNMEVVQFRGHTGRFLESAAGKPSLDIFKLAKEGLFLPLRATIYKAREIRHTVKREANDVKYNGRRMRVNITVVPVKSGPLREEFFLVLFDEIAKAVASKNLPKGRGKISLKGKSVKSDKYVNELQKELAETKEYLQAVIEEQESANEEVKTANEEILSSNEELQSTNEELETAKEELQSSNEELVTTNEELQNRNKEVVLLNNDLINLLSSINMPVIMMGTDLVIRRITPQAEKALNVIPSDIDRPISKIKLNVDIPDFEKILLDVIETLHPKTFEIKSREGNWYSVYIRPYRTLDNKIDGVVAIFIDITDSKKAQQIIEDARGYAENILETIREPLIVLDTDLKVISANRSFYQTFKVNPNETKGRFIYDLGNRQWDIPKLRQLLEEILPKNNTFDDYEIEHNFETIGPKTMLFNARCLATMQMILITIEDITKRKKAEDSQKLLVDILNTLNEGHGNIDAFEKILFLIKEFMKFDAVGIRLREGEDFPYYVTNGFPAHFVEAENHLCARDNKGELVRDPQGKVILECMCGNILCGRTDPTLPFFTEGGSFWTNSTTDLLRTTTDKERQTHTRNRCNAVGYESVALIPLRSGREIIGLLQLNDKRRNMLTLKMIKFFEEIQTSVSLTLLRKKAEENVKKTMEIKSKFASMVSHELRSPLGSIKEGINLVLEGLAGNINDEQRDLLDTAKRNADRLGRLINNVLDFQKMESGKIAFDVRENDINEAVLEVNKPMSLLAKEKGLDLVIDADDSVPRVRFDKDKIVGVLTNLVGNAIEYTEKGSITISTKQEDDAVHVIVQDTGIGIKAEDMEKLFCAFEQLGLTKDRKKGGTGLGLAISKEIILVHKGKIWAESEAGKGSAFHFTIPRKLKEKKKIGEVLVGAGKITGEDLKKALENQEKQE